MERSEILVHISAPCGVSDDARYRAQVEAILGFQSASRQVITSRADNSRSDHDDTTSAATSDGLPSNRTPPQKPVIPLNDIPNHPAMMISNGIIALERQPHSCSQTDFLDSPVSVIPDSQPGRLSSDPDNLQNVDRQPSTIPPPWPPCSPDVPPTKRDRTISLSPRGGLKKPRHIQRKADEADIAQTGDLAVLPTTSFPAPAEIRPPLPPISREQFITHITPTLEMLATRLKGRTYSPLQQTRELHKLERGHWYLRINVIEAETHESNVSTEGSNGACNWDISMFSRFWSFLADFIKEGRAGWGVWCILEDVPNSQSPRDSLRSAWREVNIRQLTLKTYAWGEIAFHVYLLLFLASERRVRKMGARWRDGRGDVVIHMP